MTSFNLRRLRYFVAVAELGSITRAASELHIVQPALSLQIRLLENEIGGQLFARGSQGVRLTELGKTLLDEGRLLLGNVRALRDRLKESLQDPEGIVVIGVAQMIGPVLALPLLDLTAKRLPCVRIQLRELQSREIPDLIRSESIDFALSYSIPSGHGVQSTTIFSEDLFLVGTSKCAKQYLKNPDLAEVAFADLKNVPLYLSPRSNSFREHMERVARDKKMKLDVIAEVDSVSIRKDIALSGTGFTILSGAMIRKEIARHGIFTARLTCPCIQRNICFVRQGGGTVSRAATEVATLVAETLSILVTKNLWPGVILPAKGIPKLV